MALKRYVTEMGMGVDVHGRDYTNAARRAVSDAIRHSSLPFFQATHKSREAMRITLIIAVTEPNAADSTAVASECQSRYVTVDGTQRRPAVHH